ncbi:hypothetical protein [Streptoalloteichus hindustanus]|uniref:Uncharacterized protein n=1 Tax=Streptoalloteichus hindustanus TaxID=2017 RepID=A0A1M5ERY2_STRHI|nr:hypothetical protein [Streptoalloteichus hindustanus]SHF81894.1 hypothetical protein SAMN05444320_105104 [Streptoalloteichus hindustanus]
MRVVLPGQRLIRAWWQGRSWRPKTLRAGSGWDVALEDVLDLLSRIEQGIVTATSVREHLLAAIAAQVPAGGCCPTCAQYIQQHQAALVLYEQQLARSTDPARWPYAIEDITLHRATCQRLPRWSDEAAYPGTLRDWAHGLNEVWHWGRAWRVTREQAQQWLVEHSGPRGRKNYQLCDHCAPDLPRALLRLA